MASLTLPARSKVQPGKAHSAKPGAKDPRTFKIYRFDPDGGANPRAGSSSTLFQKISSPLYRGG